MSTQENTEEAVRLDPVEKAIERLAAGGMVVVVDDANRENEGDIIFAADASTQENMAFTIRYSSGVLCTPMPRAVAERLNLPSMVQENEDPKGTAYTISCDASTGVHTGISAADRARTARVLADLSSTAEMLTRPGHLFPLIAVDGGVLARRGHTEAAVDLLTLAGRSSVGVIAELNHDDGEMMRLPALREFSDEHDLPLISIEDLVEYRKAKETTGTADASSLLELKGEEAEVLPLLPSTTGTEEVSLPTDYGTFTVRSWRMSDGTEHLSLSVPRKHTQDAQGSAAPQGSDTQNPPLVRVHSECLTGDAFSSYRCDCGEQLAQSLRMVQAEGGSVIYVRGHEGRGIGLFEKMRAYALQERGKDTLDANLELGFPADARDYANTAAILNELGLKRITLITNNPHKGQELASYGIEIAQTRPCVIPAREDNAFYLRTKAEKMGHLIPELLPEPPAENGGASSNAS